MIKLAKINILVFIDGNICIKLSVNELSDVLTKYSSRSIRVAIKHPLGPGELLTLYGTEKQNF